VEKKKPRVVGGRKVRKERGAEGPASTSGGLGMGKKRARKRRGKAMRKRESTREQKI